MSETHPASTTDLKYPELGGLSTSAKPLDSAAAERRAVEIAQAIFPGPISVEDGLDPEDPQFKMRVVTVTAQGDVADIRTRSKAWHQAMIEQLGTSGDHITIWINMESS